MKKFDKLYNDIINKFNEDNNILIELKKMVFCPYILNIEQKIKNPYKRIQQKYYNFFVDVSRDSSAIFGEYHFYYRIIDRCPQYTVFQIQSFIKQGLEKFLNDNYYSRWWNLKEFDKDIVFTIFSKSYSDIKIKIQIFKTNILNNLLFNSNNNSDYTCILNTILLSNMEDFKNDKPEHRLTIVENSPSFKYSINENFSFSIYELLDNNIFKNTIPIEID